MIACCHDGWCGVHQSGTVLLVPFAIVALVSVKVCSGNRSVEFSSTSNLVHVFSFFLAGMSFFSFFLFCSHLGVISTARIQSPERTIN